MNEVEMPLVAAYDRLDAQTQAKVAKLLLAFTEGYFKALAKAKGPLETTTEMYQYVATLIDGLCI